MIEGFGTSVCQPSTFRMLIWLEASSAQKSIAAVSADGSTVCDYSAYLMRRHSMRHGTDFKSVAIASRVQLTPAPRAKLLPSRIMEMAQRGVKEHQKNAR